MFNKNVVIYDYEIGNYQSIYNCVKKINYNLAVSNKINVLKKADLIILPGVGTFNKAMTVINNNKKKEFIGLIKKGKNVLGICLGMQLMTKSSLEIKKTNGLNLISAEVVSNFKGPHIGWNSISVNKKSIFKNLNNKLFYFQHSFKVIDLKKNYDQGFSVNGEAINSIFTHKNITGVQFHPENSQENGMLFFKSYFEKFIC